MSVLIWWLPIACPARHVSSHQQHHNTEIDYRYRYVDKKYICIYTYIYLYVCTYIYIYVDIDIDQDSPDSSRPPVRAAQPSRKSSSAALGGASRGGPGSRRSTPCLLCIIYTKPSEPTHHFMRMYICMHFYKIHTYIYLYVLKYVHTCMAIHTCIHLYVLTYVHTYTYT